jgi:hypothetical protein
VGGVFISPAFGQGVCALDADSPDLAVLWKRAPKGEVRDGRPMHLAFDAAAGRLWVGDLDGPGVVALDARTGETVFSLKLPHEVVGIALSSNGKRLVAGARDALEAYVIDAVHGTLSGTVVTGTVPAGATLPPFFTAHPAFVDGDRAALVQDHVNGALVRIDLARLVVEERIEIGGPVHAIDRAGDRLVGLAEGTPGKHPPRLLALEPRTGRVIASLDIPLEPEETCRLHHGCFSQDGQRYYVANMGPLKEPAAGAGRTIALIDLSDAAKPKLIARAVAGAGAGHPILAPDRETLWVVNHHETFASRFDAKTLELRGLFELVKARGFGHGVAFTRSGALLLLATSEKAVLRVDPAGTVVRRPIEAAPGELECGW